MPPRSPSSDLIRWYRRHRRDLPWRRRGHDAYAQLVAELMLQQTQVATVIDYYQRFMDRFPTVGDLARADLDDVLHLWAGLGYYRRARHLHAAAREIVGRFDGVLPADVDSLLTLPGIGRYTAGAIASIAYDTRAPILDGNVTRVLMRLAAIDDDPKSPALKTRLWAMAESLLPDRDCGDFNQGLMELGATVCKPQSPDCEACPLAGECRARERGLTAGIPRVAKRATVKAADFVVAAVRHGEQLLFVQRPPAGLWAGLWELPTEPVEPGESLQAARSRLRKRLPKGCRLAADAVAAVRRQLTHRNVTFHVFVGTASGEVSDAPGGLWLLEQTPKAHGKLTVGISSATQAILQALQTR